MKATELMVGDWVLYGEKPRQVRYINDRVWWDGSCHNDEIGFTHHEDEWIAAHNAKPIPLTPEVFEKNPQVEELGYWDERCNLFRLYAMPCINLWSVDILQKSLRLCGQFELADNFKV